MSAGWRTAPTAAQHGLQHRPPHVMQHMRSTFEKAADIPCENVLLKDDGTYAVVSSSSAGKRYNVCFGGITLGVMPSCECMAWQRSHLPCKHMCAAMLHSNLSWEVFPTTYREHPILQVDSECLGIRNSTANDSVVPVAVNDEEVDQSAPPRECVSSDSSTASKTAVQKHGSALRDVLKQLDNLSYVVQSSEALQEATRSAELIHCKLLAECPVSDGLLLEANVTKPKAQRRKRSLEVPSVTTKKLRTGKCDV